ncbi:MAG: hypothetical protein IT259_13125 [Saprospiraceae bacterium]|nr:hypothetical protein [Saprospiraceae bacterium]
MKRKHRILTLFLLLTCALARAQSSAAFDSTVVETGEAFSLHLSVMGWGAEPEQIDFSAWESVFPPENILRESGWYLDGDTWTNDVTLISFDSAELHLPPLSIRRRDGSTEETNPLQLTVVPTPSPNDPIDLADIADIRREAFHWLDALPWVLLVGGLCGLAALVWWLLVRRKQRGPRSRTVQLPPHELALRELDALARRNLWQQHQIKVYYETLTYIARQYIQQRFGVPALESVSDETMYRLRKTDFPPELLPPLENLLHTADRVKFAKGEPPADYHETALLQVRQLVQQTIPPPPAEPEKK